jgi:solute carrier family 25 S-adenosylmethionine transporter 26
MDKSMDKPSFGVALVSGGVAGTVTDVALFPLDTIKTRLQSAQGFRAAGGFRGVYKGLSAAALGSAPGAAIFFSTYEMSKQAVEKPAAARGIHASVVHMGCASLGEVMACLVRVPTEVVKQRMQAGMHSSMASVVNDVLRNQGVFGLYQGYGITIMREIPFSLVQFPLYEVMKGKIRAARGGKEPFAVESALCGSLSGAIAAAATTPLDVLKTRLMLGSDAEGRPYTGVADTLTRLVEEGRASGPGGVNRVLFSGLGPRVMWISIGGFVFFGAYEQSKRAIISLS